jgi:hypothetical protein
MSSVETTMTLSNVEWGKAICFTLMGDPVAQARARGLHFYNPDRSEQIAFREKLIAALHAGSTDTGNGTTHYPVFFAAHQALLVKVTFFLRRPNEHFKNRVRGIGRLKAFASSARKDLPNKKDVDNLLKFLLDGMSTVIYGDDRTVMITVAMKDWDSEGMCEGRTAVFTKRVTRSVIDEFNLSFTG